MRGLSDSFFAYTESSDFTWTGYLGTVNILMIMIIIFIKMTADQGVNNNEYTGENGDIHRPC